MIAKRPKGTQDWYGEAMRRRAWVEEKARSLCKAYDIKEIITPAFEEIDLFQRGVGESTDVVQKEMYDFYDKGDRHMALKPEGTAGAIRAYLENSLYAASQPTKLFYVTQAFRYEKPQSGRLRQHHQFGVEFIGSESPLAEVELVSFLTELMRELGISGARLHINSIGCPSCRKAYNEALLSYLREREDGLCETCRERMRKNPLRVIDCKVPSCQEIVRDAPRTVDYLDAECGEHFEELKGLLDELSIPYEVDTGIVRGLDYYTRTVFEFVSEDGLTLCGGGRYDNLVREIDGKLDVPAVGFGMGIERILGFLEKEGAEAPKEPPVELYVGILGKEARARAYGIVERLRLSGVIVETDYMGRSAKAQMKYANKIGARHAVILGPDELRDGRAVLRDMETHEEETVEIDRIAERFGAR